MTLQQKRNPRYALDLACPICGHMLHYFGSENMFGVFTRLPVIQKHKNRWFASDRSIEETRRVDCFESEIVGQMYITTYEYQCPNHDCKCFGDLITEEQAVKRTFKVGELPADFYLDERGNAQLPMESLQGESA